MTLQEFQKLLIKNKLDAYILTRNNMFLGQDVLEDENKILELTGFSGSAGNLIIFRDKTFLLVDGRYELQASLEVDTSAITVITTSDSIATWIQNNIKDPCTFAYNPWCHSISEVDYWNRSLKRHTFVADEKELLGPRLTGKETNFFEHEIEFAGISMDEKISYLTDFMKQKNLDAFFIPECDCLSWLLNLRSDCLPDTPLIRAFALIDKNGEISLFTNDFRKIEVEAAKYKGLNIGCNFKQTPKQIQNIFKNHRIWVDNLENPITLWKATKNAIEQQGFKQAHLRDGKAMVNFLFWLEKNWPGQDELSIVQKLHQFRQQEKNFFSNSFETIAGFAENGAIVHYKPTPKSNKKLKEGSILLLDSGAQYYEATTDVTRTIAIGKPTQEMIDSYTQVLKAHIAVASVYFPVGTPGCALDALARAQLWKYGKDYNHGTGHGVGCFLNVHEGPQSISSRGNAPFAANMVTSIEPGYYKEGHFGIRIENLALSVPETSLASNKEMLKFSILTLVPLDKSLINKYLLNNQEISWVNQYHEKVYTELAPALEPSVAKWLKKACSPL